RLKICRRSRLAKVALYSLSREAHCPPPRAAAYRKPLLSMQSSSDRGGARPVAGCSKNAGRVGRRIAEPRSVKLTRSPLEQLDRFRDDAVDQVVVEGQGLGHGESVLLRPAPNLGEGYIEAVILNEGDEPVSTARGLFPS